MENFSENYHMGNNDQIRTILKLNFKSYFVIKSIPGVNSMLGNLLEVGFPPK